MLRVYAAGGTGVNIAKQINDLNIDICYIDTSKSNLKTIDSDNVFLLEDFDGAGKHRATTYEGFKNLAEDVLIRFKPSAHLNVVISSLSGGSGSIIAPLLTKELNKNNYNTIVIGIDSRHSFIEIDNTIKTLKTYKSISDSISKCISLYYVENSSRKQADAESINFINLLSLLIDKHNTEEFDISDLSNFINFNKVTDNEANVSIIEVHPNEVIVPEKNTTIVSSILLTTDKNTTIEKVIPEYLSVCVVTDPNYRNKDIRVDNILGKLPIIVDSLDKSIKEHQDNKKINKFKTLEVTSNTSDGVVL